MTELRLHFLGTGSAKPTLHRGCAAVGLQYGADTLLLDCGEGTQRQLLESPFRLSRLRAIGLTHFHGDHVNGLPGLIGTMGLQGHRDTLTLIGPAGLSKWLRTLRELDILKPAFGLKLVDHAEPVVLQDADYELRTFAMEHRIPTRGYLFVERDRPGRFDLEAAQALGVPAGPLYGRLQRGESVTLPDGRVVHPDQVVGPMRRGRRVVYASDTRPCASVIEAATGADVLIHEATYLHEHHDQAVDRWHSTVREAAQVALAAGVGQLVLTHISPKHMRRKELLAEAHEVFPNVVVAQDLLELDVAMR